MKSNFEYRLKSYNWLYFFVGAIFVLLAIYLPTLNFPFQYDDIANITKNFSIRGFNFWDLCMRHSRWLGEMINQLNFKIGEASPITYRIFNLMIHLTCGLLTFSVTSELAEKAKKTSVLFNNSFEIGFLSMLFFLLHPVATQTVCYVVQARFEGLATMLSLAAILLLIKSISKNSLTQSSAALFVGANIFLFLACSIKEIAITTPILAALADFYFVADANVSKFFKRWWIHAIFFAVAIGTCIYYLKFDYLKSLFCLTSTAYNNRGNIVTQNALGLISATNFLWSEFLVILHYLKIYFLPVGLCVEYDFELKTSFFSSGVIIPLISLIFASLAALSATFIFEKSRPYAFGLFWFLGSVVPRAFFAPSPELACDYKTYLASVGFCFALAALFCQFSLVELKDSLSDAKSFAQKNFVWLILAAFFAVLSAQRTFVWGDQITFWKDIVEKNPNRARAHNNLAVALTEVGKITEAIPLYQRAIELDQYYPDPCSNLAVALSTLDRYDEAICALKQAISIVPNYPEAYNNIANIYLKQKKYDECREMLNKAIEIRPFYGKAHFNMGRLLLELDKKEEAFAYFKAATEKDLDTIEGFYALGQICMMMEKYDEAEKAFKRVYQKGERNEAVLFNLANAKFMIKDFAGAEKLYTECLKTQPDNGHAVHNLAEACFMQEKYEQALALFAKFEGIFDQTPNALFRCITCLEKVKDIHTALAFAEKYKAMQFDTSILEDFKKELGRLRLQAKINDGNATFNGEELQALFNV